MHRTNVSTHTPAANRFTTPGSSSTATPATLQPIHEQGASTAPSESSINEMFKTLKDLNQPGSRESSGFMKSLPPPALEILFADKKIQKWIGFRRGADHSPMGRKIEAHEYASLGNERTVHPDEQAQMLALMYLSVPAQEGREALNTLGRVLKAGGRAPTFDLVEPLIRKIPQAGPQERDGLLKFFKAHVRFLQAEDKQGRLKPALREALAETALALDPKSTEAAATIEFLKSLSSKSPQAYERMFFSASLPGLETGTSAPEESEVFGKRLIGLAEKLPAFKPESAPALMEIFHKQMEHARPKERHRLVETLRYLEKRLGSARVPNLSTVKNRFHELEHARALKEWESDPLLDPVGPFP